MTEKEAIKDIKENIKPVVGGKSLDMAIKALEKQISLKRIVKRLEELQEEYMYPDDDDYIVGQYDGVREALTVVLEEGGLNEI